MEKKPGLIVLTVCFRFVAATPMALKPVLRAVDEDRLLAIEHGWD